MTQTAVSPPRPPLPPSGCSGTAFPSAQASLHRRASGSKYSFLGAMRSAAQLISYEVSMGLALLGAIMMAGTLSLTGVVDAQGELWYIVPQIVGFLIFMVAGFAGDGVEVDVLER